ncbi:hypothetical protein I5M27_09865 [Adhaeribacter sp. BT258]|uniref:Outer membrane protein beta-barrel domain-containing protein n=1 Tax=Adhaeribacter terrigena TaxID=2793070 RepID=A0ABS1C1P5_9BACT|nr:hypothetical protein [Adhaeribacter terrigena]MBK0403292.1 hypothetical protein [Adhaeribacter terrigena]
MKKILLTAALVGGFFWNASAQNGKTTTKTKTTTGTTTGTSTTTTTQENNAGGTEQTSTSSSGGFFQRAQNTNGDIKATGGDIALEANVNILSGGVSLSNSLNQIRGRYFLSNDMALRLGTHLSFNTTTPDPDTKTRAIEFSIAPGIEKHFAGTNRLSPYVAAELLIGLRSAHAEMDGPGNSEIEVKGAFGNGDNNSRGYFLVGLGAVGGCDFYIARHLFVGYELSMELSNRSFSEIETITTLADGTVITNKTDGNSAFSFGPNVRNGIRVGFVF